MKTIFLDCGTNKGQGFDSLSSKYELPEDTEVYMFEPNLKCFEIIKEKYPNYNLLNKAVWNADEIKLLNVEFCPIEKDYVGGATNILTNNFKKPKYIKKEHMKQWPPDKSQETECIDLSNFIQTNFKMDDYIYLKLDIEGAEYEVLDKTIIDGTLPYIDTIIVEWHERIRKTTKHSNRYYIKAFKQHNINYLEWY